MQSLVLLITLLGIGFISFIFIYVIRHSRKRDEDYGAIVKTAYGLRSAWFAGLLTLGVLVTVFSLAPFPIAGAGTGNEQVINAIGGQWYWKLDNHEVTVNQPVLFNVTSADVNHGFAIYNDRDEILTQAQAMPGYINHLRYTFTQPGLYRVLCLEYCGVAHHAMKAEITVKGAK